MFPFKASEFERDEKYMEEETSFYWERDNSNWYRVVVDNDREYYIRNTWGDIKWDGDKPYPKLVKKVEAFIEEHSDDIPEEPGYWAKSKPDWEPLKIPGTRATIHEWINDSTF